MSGLSFFIHDGLKMDVRIPLDSEIWSKLVGGNNVRKMLVEMAEKEPNPEDIAKMISEVDGGEYMEHAFYYLVPYLLDHYEKSPFKLRATMVDFSRGIINMLSNIPPDESNVQILASRNRIVDVLCKALEYVGSDDDFKIHLGAIAAVYQKPEIGREVMFIGIE